MINRIAMLAGAALLTACGPRNFPTIPAPTPAPVQAPPITITEAPLDWHLRDAAADRLPGISLLKAERELLASKKPQRTVVVAIIDSGVDTTHSELRPQMWTNPRETPGNGRDDDGNGYVDDVRGWNLLGGKDGKNVDEDTFEVTRLAAQCGRPAARDSLPVETRARCPEIEAEFTKKRQETDQTLAAIGNFEGLYAQITPILQRARGTTDSLTLDKVNAIVPANDSVGRAKQLYQRLHGQGLTEQEIADAKKAYKSRAEYGFNKDFDPRRIVGDDYPGTSVMKYGNADVIGPDAMHGTHVAGIVGAIKDAVGATGIAQSVRIMAIRTVPDGDERDKDVAQAIRYAADHGAHIINMSFGKSWSPYKKLVDDAVKYADSKGVLMVHAAGNDAADATKEASFPTPFYMEGGRAANWIEVGATSWKPADSLVATFSNYGKGVVDLFAPGDDIYSTVPGGKHKKESGTSMASPVVAGVAALLMSYYPTLTAADTRRIILESVVKPNVNVIRPGETPMTVPFSDLSTTGGIVNVYNAIKLAEQMTTMRP